MDNPARFERLVEPLHDRALAFARCLARTASDGDDLFQEAMLRAFRKLDGLRDDGAARTWLYRVIVTVHRSRGRRAWLRRVVPFGTAEDIEGEVPYRSAAWNPAQLEAHRRARTALAKLPATQREAIVLLEIEGWTVEEIAAVQHVSASAIKSRLARGRDRMRALYEDSPTLATEEVTR